MRVDKAMGNKSMIMKLVRRGVLAQAILGAVLVAGCTPSTQGSQGIPSGSPTTGGSASPTVSPSAGVSELPGTVFYLSPGYSQETRVFADKITLIARRGNEAPQPLGIFATAGDRMFETTVTLSPDGRNLAWLDDDRQLLTGKVNGTGSRVLARGLATSVCGRPIWTPDSQRVIFPGRSGDDPAQIIKIDGTDLKPLKTPYPCSHISLLDGKRLGWTRFDGDQPNLIIGDMASGATQRFPLKVRSLDLVAISPDASRAVVILEPPSSMEGTAPTDEDKRYQTYPERAIHVVLLDIATGAGIPAPIAGDLIAARYLKDGTLLLRSVVEGKFWMTIVNDKDEVLARTAETAEMAKDNFLGYVP